MILTIPLSTTEQVHLRLFIGVVLSSQHWFCIQPCTSKRSPCVVGFMLTRSLAISCTDRGFWPCRDSSAAAAAATYNMWPQCLPGFPLSTFHYSLFNLSPCCWTAVQSPTAFGSCQESLCPFIFPSKRFDLPKNRKLNSLRTENVAEYVGVFEQSSVASNSRR